MIPPRRSPREIDHEVETHLDLRAAELEASGLSPEEARRRAEAEFGDVELTRAYCAAEDRRRLRRERVRGSLGAVVDESRAAVRSLRRRPLAVLAPVAVLSLAIGLNTAVFGIVRGVLLAPLPFSAEERVMVLEEVQEGGGLVRASYPVIAAWRDRASTLEAVTGFVENEFPVMASGSAVHMEGASVAEGFFDMLHRPFLIGPGFAAADHAPGADPTVAVSEETWRGALGARPDVVGSTIRISGAEHRVVGVVASRAVFPEDARVWIPMEPGQPEYLRFPGAKFLWAAGRLRPGVDAAAAARELGAISASVDGGAPGASATPVRERITGDVREPIVLLQGAVLLVLLAAAVNAAGMLLTRAVRRRTETAVRVSLGASPWRVRTGLLAEGAALGVLAGVLGLALGAALLPLARAIVPPDVPRVGSVSLDVPVASFGVALAVLTGLGTALVTVLASRRAPASALRSTTGQAGADPRTRRALEGLVIGQVALATVLTVGAGLLLRSFVLTVREDPGFDPRGVTVVDISLPGHRYAEKADRVRFARTLLDRAAELPGAEAVAIGRNLPISGSDMTSPLRVEGSAETTEAVQVAAVTSGYFRVMGIRVRGGDGFRDADRDGAVPIMVVGEGIVTAEGRTLDVGDRARSFFGASEPREVVGVAEGVRHAGLREAPAPLVYEPFFEKSPAGFSLLVRSTAPTAAVADALRGVVRDLDPELPVDRMSSMDTRIRRSLAEPRFYTVVLGLFGALAAVLALAGCQAALAHRVAAQRRELGLRMALGATARALRGTVVRRGLALVAVGTALGIVLSVLAGDALRTQLYGVEPVDPPTYLAMALLILVAGALAADVPARRAAGTDPATTLREG